MPGGARPPPPRHPLCGVRKEKAGRTSASGSVESHSNCARSSHILTTQAQRHQGRQSRSADDADFADLNFKICGHLRNLRITAFTSFLLFFRPVLRDCSPGLKGLSRSARGPMGTAPGGQLHHAIARCSRSRFRCGRPTDDGSSPVGLDCDCSRDSPSTGSVREVSATDHERSLAAWNRLECQARKNRSCYGGTGNVMNCSGEHAS